MECVESALLIGCIRKKSEIGPWAVMQGPRKQSLKAQGVGVVEVLPLFSGGFSSVTHRWEGLYLRTTGIPRFSFMATILFWGHSYSPRAC